MAGKYYESLTITITPDLREKIQELARDNEITVSAMCRQLLRKEIGRYENSKSG